MPLLTHQLVIHRCSPIGSQRSACAACSPGAKSQCKKRLGWPRQEADDAPTETSETGAPALAPPHAGPGSSLTPRRLASLHREEL